MNSKFTHICELLIMNSKFTQNCHFKINLNYVVQHRETADEKIVCVSLTTVLDRLFTPWLFHVPAHLS